MCIDMLDQTVSVFAELEEICFFLCRLYLTATVRAFAVHKLCFREEGFTRCTVHAFVLTLVDIALIV